MKLLADQRSRVLGSRIRSRMLVGALLLSFAPAVFMFLFSFGLLNRSMERWFSQPASQLREDSTRVSLELSQYAAANARAEAESLASSPNLSHALQTGDTEALLREIGTHRITLEGGFVVVFRNGAAVGQYQLPRDDGQAIIRSWMDQAVTDVPQGHETLAATVLRAAQRSDVPMLVTGKDEYVSRPSQHRRRRHRGRRPAPALRAKRYGAGHPLRARGITRSSIAIADASAPLTCCCCFC